MFSAQCTLGIVVVQVGEINRVGLRVEFFMLTTGRQQITIILRVNSSVNIWRKLTLRVKVNHLI